MSANPFEQANRAKKVAALVAHFDRFLLGAGLSPFADALQMIQSLEAMKAEVRPASRSRRASPPVAK